MKRRATHYASPTVSYNKNAIRLLDQKTPQHGQQNHKRIHIRTTTTITTKNTFSAFEKTSEHCDDNAIPLSNWLR